MEPIIFTVQVEHVYNKADRIEGNLSFARCNPNCRKVGMQQNECNELQILYSLQDIENISTVISEIFHNIIKKMFAHQHHVETSLDRGNKSKKTCGRRNMWQLTRLTGSRSDER